MKTLFATITLLAVLVGCASPQRTAYITLSAIGQGVDSAMSAAADATVAGKVSAEDWQRIAVVHSQFRAAYKTACELAAFDYSKAATPELLKLERLVLDTIAQILKAK